MTLRIQAQDGASIPYQAHTNLTVRILDENDEIPTFTQDEYSVTLMEGAGSGTHVLTATALDRDRGLNGTIRYSLDPQVYSDYPGFFRLDQDTGRITTQKSLDREEYDGFTLILTAQDRGNPPQSSSVQISINVTDQNDNFPVFYPLHYYARVEESEPAHTSVIQVSHVTVKLL